MGFLDNVQNTPAPAANGSRDIVFATLPADFEGFKALPQASLQDPYATAALTVLAFCYYPKNRDLSLAMLDYLRGPRPLSTYDKQFIRDRFMDKDYVPRSYFIGATPQNDYEPAAPYTIRVMPNPRGDADATLKTLFIQSGGADSPRMVKARLAKDGKWYLWEQFLLSGIRALESTNPWA